MWIMINFLLSSFQIAVVGYLLTHHLKHHPINPSDFKAIVSWMHYHVEQFYYAVIGLHVVSGVVTATLLCWDCPCWLGEGEWRVYDPDNPGARLIWRGGRVVGGEDDKPDEEMTGGNQIPGRDFLQDIYEDAYNEDKYTNIEILEILSGVTK